MRFVAAALTVLLAGGCHREPGFDERYASTQQTLSSEAAALESDLATRESDAAAAGATSDAADEATD